MQRLAVVRRAASVAVACAAAGGSVGTAYGILMTTSRTGKQATLKMMDLEITTGEGVDGAKQVDGTMTAPPETQTSALQKAGVPQKFEFEACCAPKGLRGNQPWGHAVESTVSRLGRMVGAAQLKEKAEDLHKALGWGADLPISERGGRTLPYGHDEVLGAVKNTAFFAQKDRKNTGGFPGPKSPYERVKRLSGEEPGAQAESKDDWVLAEHLSDCIDSNANGWDPNMKDAYLRRPSDVVNVLDRLQEEEDQARKGKAVGPQAGQAPEKGALSPEDAPARLAAAQSEMETLHSAFPEAASAKRSMFLRLLIRVPLMKIGIMRYMNAIDIGHLRNIILPAIRKTCNAKKPAGKLAWFD